MITLNFDNDDLLIKCSGKTFSEQIDSVKDLGAHYDAKRKVWVIGIGKYPEVVKELEHYKIDLSEYDRIEIENYFKRIDELKVITKRSEMRKYNQELLSYPPLKD